MARIAAQTGDWRKALLVLLCIFAGCNHSVRLLGSNVAQSTMSNFGSYSIVSSALSSMNDTRSGIGGFIQSASKSCPESIKPACEVVGQGMNTLLGTY